MRLHITTLVSHYDEARGWTMHDLVIRGGTVVDGTGRTPRPADVAIDDGRITAVGTLPAPEGREVIDATDRIVTPGFVDVHTHYDGQITWDPLLTPSCWHGVTTVVMGNCGVGFAPARPDRRNWLIGLMEGVEDIPGAALSAGIRWAWESFPEFLDTLQSLPKAIDIGTQVPHGSIRAYVMGERGARNEPATPDDIDAMAALVKEGIEAGALGFSTSRTIAHRAIDGEPVPGTFAATDELFGIGAALAEAGAGVFELAPAGVMGEDLAAPDREMAWMRALADKTGRPVTYALLQHDLAPDDWKRLLDLAGDAADDGVPLRPQVAGRPLGLLIGLQTFHPLSRRKAYAELAHLPLDALVDELRKPDVRRAILDEQPEQRGSGPNAYIHLGLDRMFPLGNPPDYEPAAEQSVAALAERAGRDGWEFFYDLLLERDGRELIMRPLLGYSDFTHEPIREMLLHPASALGLGDGGAHVGAICDASTPTYMLTHWVRDRSRGPRLPLEWVVRKMTADTATLYGLGDRGVLAEGKKADVNVIDLDRLQLDPPEMMYDLPGGARRLLQTAVGYDATIVAGKVVLRDGVDTGSRPGALVRGAR
ncbi:MAG TPA: amidohydrolase family protein [Acidimicrobiales bacterium]|nr:amidohydrolase family protein [Acidimicrobiales bacterium]